MPRHSSLKIEEGAAERAALVALVQAAGLRGDHPADWSLYGARALIRDALLNTVGTGATHLPRGGAALVATLAERLLRGPDGPHPAIVAAHGRAHACRGERKAA